MSPEGSSVATRGPGASVLRWRLIAGGATLVATVIIARVLGPEGRGAYALYLAAATILLALARLGLEHANLYFHAARRIPLPDLHAVNALVAFTTGTIGVAIMAFLPTLLPGVFGDASPALLLLAGAIIPFSAHQQLAGSLQAIEGRPARQFVALAAGAIVQVAALLVVAWSRGLTVWWVLAINLGTVLLAWLATVGLAGARGPVGPWNVPLLRDALRHSLGLHIGTALLFLHLRVDLFMLKGLTDLESVGIYSIALLLVEMAQLATASIMPALAMRHVGASLQESAIAALHGARLSAIVAFMSCVVLAVVGYGLILLLFGRAFVPAFGPLLALLPGIVFTSMQQVCGPVVLRTGAFVQMAALYAAGLAANILLGALLIPSLGMAGAGFASTLAGALSCLLFLGWTARLSGLSLASAIPGRGDVEEVLAALNRFMRGPDYRPRPKKQYR